MAVDFSLGDWQKTLAGKGSQGEGGGLTEGVVGGGATGFALGGPVGAGIGAAAGGVMKAIGLGKGGGGSTTQQGFQLPGAGNELAFMDTLNDNLLQIDQNFSKLSEIGEIYDKQLEVVGRGIRNTIPPSQVQRDLTQQSAQLALTMGQSAQQLAENGFLSEQEASLLSNAQRDLEQARSLSTGQGGFNEVTQREYENQKAQFEAQLSAAGIRDQASRQMALQQFESSFRQNQANALLAFGQSQAGLAAQQANVRQANFAMGQQALNAMTGQIGQARIGYQTLENLAASGAQMDLTQMQTQAGLRQERNEQFKTLGQFSFSGQGKQYANQYPLGTTEEQRQVLRQKAEKEEEARKRQALGQPVVSSIPINQKR